MLQIYEALGGASGRVPRLSPPSKGSQSLLGGLPGPTLTIEQPGWRFSSEPGDLTVSVFEDSYAVESVNYETWAGEVGFRKLLETTSRAVGEHLHPTVESRVGLRYVNQIVTPEVTEPSGWHGLIGDAFLGPVVLPQAADGVKALEARTALDIGSGNSCLLRYRSFLDSSRPGLQTFLIDIDCFREGGTPFSVDSILTLAEELNTAALAIFQMVTTEDLRSHFKDSSA